MTVLNVAHPVLLGPLFQSLPYPPVPPPLFAVDYVCVCLLHLLLSQCLMLVPFGCPQCRLPEWVSDPLLVLPVCRSLAPCAYGVSFAPAFGAGPSGDWVFTFPIASPPGVHMDAYPFAVSACMVLSDGA